MVKNIDPDPGQSSNPGELVNVAGTLYFSASDGGGPSEHGTELWKSEPPYDAASTTMVEDIRMGTASSSPSGLTAAAGQVYFDADDGSTGREPWKSDGTPGGTVRVKDIAPTTEDSDPDEFTAIGSTVYFGAGSSSEPEGEEDVELWKTAPPYDDASTTRVKDINTLDPKGSDPQELTAYNGKLLFAAADGPDGAENRELWISDGTAGNTVKLAEINASGDSRPGLFTELGGILYFPANDGPAAHGAELWRTDGTPAGTSLAVDVMPGPTGSSIGRMTVHGFDLLFNATGDAAGREVWRSNGGPLGAGTARVSDIAPGPGSGAIDPGVKVGEARFMEADDSGVGANRELWRAVVEPFPPAPPATPAAPAPPKRKCKKGRKLKKGKCVKKKRKKRRR